jgi:hypothetical protein
LIADARSHFDKVKILKNGFLKPSKRSMADVVTSTETLPRILHLASEFYLALEDSGYRVILAPQDQKLHRISISSGDSHEYHRPWYPQRATVAFIGTVAYGLTVYELKEQAEVRYSDRKYVRVPPTSPSARRDPLSEYRYTFKEDMPNGKICIRAYSPYGMVSWMQEWKEKSPGSMTNGLRAIVKELEADASEMVKRIEEGERRAEIHRKEQEVRLRELEREMAQRKLERATEESRKEIFEIIKDWGLGKRIEEFLEEVSKQAALLEDTERRPIIERLEKARELLGGVDALKRLRSWRAPSEILETMRGSYY